jgi:hypothetical protein
LLFLLRENASVDAKVGAQGEIGAGEKKWLTV